MTWCWDFIDWGDAAGWAQAVFTVVAIWFTAHITKKQIQADDNRRSLDRQDSEKAASEALRRKMDEEERARALREQAVVALLFGEMQMATRGLLDGRYLLRTVARTPAADRGKCPMPMVVTEEFYLSGMRDNLMLLNPTLCALVSDCIAQLRYINTQVEGGEFSSYDANDLLALAGLFEGATADCMQALEQLLLLHPRAARFRVLMDSLRAANVREHIPMTLAQ